MSKTIMSVKIKFDQTKRKMVDEELQQYMKAKRQGNGSHKSKKDYSRKAKKVSGEY
jgi:hypothetical protein